jgi:3-oxoacyl-[acyl-carrier-protein] synthase-3
MPARISHIAFHFPQKKVTNQDLIDENLHWDIKQIEHKTGIFSRFIAQKNETSADLAFHAAQKLIEEHSIDPDRIDTLLFCTQTPDFFLPTSACTLQDRLGLKQSTAAFDINLGCSGYIYGLAVCRSLIDSGISQSILFLCADTYSKLIEGNNRTARTIFGDGAAASLIDTERKEQRIGPFVLGTNGKGMDKIIVPHGAGRDNFHINENIAIEIDGPGVFMFTMEKVPVCVKELLSKSGKTMNDIDLVIFHQASKIVLDNVSRILGLNEKKVFRGFENIGNTVSASIPIAVKQAQEANRIKKGDSVMLVGFGVGLSWGACLVEF